jgi:hypothetical protein
VKRLRLIGRVRWRDGVPEQASGQLVYITPDLAHVLTKTRCLKRSL